VDASNTSLGGSGMSLVICRGIIDRHGGRIWVDSQPGMGTTVHFTMPLAPPARHVHSAAPPVVASTEGDTRVSPLRGEGTPDSRPLP
jgi:Histidine kinase-, DNA gyrase B-, and HSP90-like ATPase